MLFESGTVEFFASWSVDFQADIAVAIDGEFGGVDGERGEGLKVEAFFDFDGKDGGVVGDVDVTEGGGGVDGGGFGWGEESGE